MTLSQDEEAGVWVPNMALMNAAEHRFEATQSKDELIIVQPDGWTLYSPTSIIETECKFDLSLFPFDTQICEIVVEDWSLSSDLLILGPHRDGFTFIRVAQLEQWTVSKGDHIFEIVNYTSKAGYSSAKFSLILKRKPGFYLLNIIVPSVIISLTEIVTFSIPLRSETRLDLSFTCLLAYGMFQNYVATTLPRSADNPPLLSIYIAMMSGYTFLATCFHGIARILYDLGSPNARLPVALQKRGFAKAANYDWHNIARKWDRFALSTYVTIVSLTPIVVFLFAPMVFDS